MITFRTFRQTKSIAPSLLGLEDLKRICLELYQINSSAADHEKKYYEGLYRPKEGDQPEANTKKQADLEREKKALENAAVTVTIEGNAGQCFTIIPDDVNKVFSDFVLPPRITKIRFDNWSNYQFTPGNQNKLRNYRVTIELDFSDSKIFTAQNPPTTNNSTVEVCGLDESWVIGTAERLRQHIERRTLWVPGVFHKILKYDVALWAFGMPLTFFGLKKLSESPVLEKSSVSTGLSALGYLMLGLLGLNIFRLFYNYVKWLFPFLELQEQSKKLQAAQRTVAAFIVLGILTGWLSLISTSVLTLVK